MQQQLPAWRRYQDDVAALLADLGFMVVVQDRITSQRGVTHEIDVAARRTVAGVEILWVVECKFWQSRVGKEKVAALTAICEDVGADRGLLMSDSGFQSGASQMAAGRNITLTSLNDLRRTAPKELLRPRQHQVDISIEPDSDIATPLFAETMGAMLSHHHVLHEDPVDLRALKNIVKQCLQAEGQQATLNPEPRDQVWDIMTGEQRWMVKTERRSIGPWVSIAKLLEARWARQCTTTPLAATHMAEQLPSRLRECDRILVVRARQTPLGCQYQLIEVPHGLLLDASASITADQVTVLNRYTFRAEFATADGPPALRLFLECSTEKVELKVSAAYVRLHGTWRVHFGGGSTNP